MKSLICVLLSSAVVSSVLVQNSGDFWDSRSHMVTARRLDLVSFQANLNDTLGFIDAQFCATIDCPTVTGDSPPTAEWCNKQCNYASLSACGVVPAQCTGVIAECPLASSVCGPSALPWTELQAGVAVDVEVANGAAPQTFRYHVSNPCRALRIEKSIHYGYALGSAQFGSAVPVGELVVEESSLTAMHYQRQYVCPVDSSAVSTRLDYTVNASHANAGTLFLFMTNSYDTKYSILIVEEDIFPTASVAPSPANCPISDPSLRCLTPGVVSLESLPFDPSDHTARLYFHLPAGTNTFALEQNGLDTFPGHPGLSDSIAVVLDDLVGVLAGDYDVDPILGSRKTPYLTVSGFGNKQISLTVPDHPNSGTDVFVLVRKLVSPLNLDLKILLLVAPDPRLRFLSFESIETRFSLANMLSHSGTVDCSNIGGQVYSWTADRLWGSSCSTHNACVGNVVVGTSPARPSWPLMSTLSLSDLEVYSLIRPNPTDENVINGPLSSFTFTIAPVIDLSTFNPVLSKFLLPSDSYSVADFSSCSFRSTGLVVDSSFSRMPDLTSFSQRPISCANSGTLSQIEVEISQAKAVVLGKKGASDDTAVLSAAYHWAALQLAWSWRSCQSLPSLPSTVTSLTGSCLSFDSQYSECCSTMLAPSRHSRKEKSLDFWKQCTHQVYGDHYSSSTLSGSLAEDLFLDCLLANDSSGLMQALVDDRGVQLSKPAIVAQFSRDNCVAVRGTNFAVHHHLLLQGTSDCVNTVLPDTVVDRPAGCQNLCSTIPPSAAIVNITQTQCANHFQCNRGGATCSTSGCDSTLSCPAGDFCGYCEDGFSCVEVPSVTASQDCVSGCLLPNGTISTTLSTEQCQALSIILPGSCSDANDIPPGGSCIYWPSKASADCSFGESKTSFGACVSSANQEGCSAVAPNAQFIQPSGDQSSCESHKACNCRLDVPCVARTITLLGQNVTECAGCSIAGVPCTWSSLFHWTPPTTIIGKLVNLKWTTSAIGSRYVWQSALDRIELGLALDRIALWTACPFVPSSMSATPPVSPTTPTTTTGTTPTTTTTTTAPSPIPTPSPPPSPVPSPVPVPAPSPTAPHVPAPTPTGGPTTKTPTSTTTTADVPTVPEGRKRIATVEVYSGDSCSGNSIESVPWDESAGPLDQNNMEFWLVEQNSPSSSCYRSAVNSGAIRFRLNITNEIPVDIDSALSIVNGTFGDCLSENGACVSFRVIPAPGVSLQLPRTQWMFPHEVEALKSLQREWSIPSWAGEPSCSWPGIVCNAYTGGVIKVCFPEKMYGNQYRDDCLPPEVLLTGKRIPKDFYNLVSLYFVDIQSRGLVGSVSPCIGRLSRLVDLDLSGNELSGSFPWKSLRSVVDLEVLDLRNNKFTGQLPSSGFVPGKLKADPTDDDDDDKCTLVNNLWDCITSPGELSTKCEAGSFPTCDQPLRDDPKCDLSVIIPPTLTTNGTTSGGGSLFADSFWFGLALVFAFVFVL